MENLDIKKLLGGETGGMSEEDLIENSRGTYFEKFVDELIASKKKMAEQKIREQMMMQKLMEGMKKANTHLQMPPPQPFVPPPGGAKPSPIPNAIPGQGNLLKLFSR